MEVEVEVEEAEEAGAELTHVRSIPHVITSHRIRVCNRLWTRLSPVYPAFCL